MNGGRRGLQALTARSVRTGRVARVRAVSIGGSIHRRIHSPCQLQAGLRDEISSARIR